MQLCFRMTFRVCLQCNPRLQKEGCIVNRPYSHPDPLPLQKVLWGGDILRPCLLLRAEGIDIFPAREDALVVSNRMHNSAYTTIIISYICRLLLCSKWSQKLECRAILIQLRHGNG